MRRSPSAATAGRGRGGPVRRGDLGLAAIGVTPIPPPGRASSDFRGRRRYQQAADLLRRRGDGTDSPLRQSYAIAAAVLDGLAVSEVIEGAGRLSALLAEVEHPGAPGHREIFAQPLARWLRHVELAAPPAEPGQPGRHRGQDAEPGAVPDRHRGRVAELRRRAYADAGRG